MQREAVEHAWDASQCFKAVLRPDKKKGAADLASAVGTGEQRDVTYADRRAPQKYLDAQVPSCSAGPPWCECS